jgi:hypothetical protein
MSVEKLPQSFCVAKTSYKGVIRENQLVKEDPAASWPGAHMRWHVHNRRALGLTRKQKKEGKSVGCFLPGLFFCSLSFWFLF